VLYKTEDFNARMSKIFCGPLPDDNPFGRGTCPQSPQPPLLVASATYLVDSLLLSDNLHTYIQQGCELTEFGVEPLAILTATLFFMLELPCSLLKHSRTQNASTQRILLYFNTKISRLFLERGA